MVVGAELPNLPSTSTYRSPYGQYIYSQSASCVDPPPDSSHVFCAHTSGELSPGTDLGSLFQVQIILEASNSARGEPLAEAVPLGGLTREGAVFAIVRITPAFVSCVVVSG
jgi:hypothetical protein